MNAKVFSAMARGFVSALGALTVGWCFSAGGQGAPGGQPSLSPEGFVFRSWGTAVGLPQNTVNAIIQTRDGYLWLATQGGLARFDGVRFKVFGLEDGLPSIVVRALFEDTKGNLWIGTTGGGLSRLRNGRLETFGAKEGEGVTDLNVTAIAEDAQGRLWVGTWAGLNLWHEGRFVREPALEDLGRPLIRALLKDVRGKIWISAVNGLFTFQDQRLAKMAGPASDPQPSPYCLLEDRQGRIWASIGNGKVLCRQNNEWITFDQATGLPFAYVTSLTESLDGTIWAGSLDSGLYGFRDGRFEAIREPDGLSSHDIRSLFADRDGHLWVGTRTSGLNRLAQRKLTVYGAAQGLTNDYVRSVAETADGALWVGTIGGGLYRGWGGHFMPFTNAATQVFPFVEAVVAARDGSVWRGGAGSLFQLREGTVAATFTRAQVEWLADAGVSALLEDVRDGLWIGTAVGRLILLRAGQSQLFSERVARGAVTSLAQEKDGTLWVGSTAGGLCRVTEGGVVPLGSTNGLLSSDVRALHLDREGVLWIGTAGGGLSRWKKGRMITFTSGQGLGDDTVSQILEDEEGHLWLGCNRGISRLTKAELEAVAEGKATLLHPRVYGLGDGMPVEECASGFCPAGLRTASGLLCFPTVKGLVLIDPRQQEVDSQPPRVLVEEVLAGGRALPIQHRLGVDHPPAVVAIGPGSRDIEFHYTGLSFAAPGKIQFRYRLEGYDKDWIEARTRRVAFYQRIPPGEFVFRVLAANADNVWTEQATVLAVAVAPYFWETRWFLFGAGAVVLASAAGAARLVERRRYRRRLAWLEMQHAVERERLRISRDMHDHVGGMLTQVSQLSDLAQDAPGDPAAVRGRLERIGTQARSAVQALDEIVWATNPQNDNLPSFAEYVSCFSDELFGPTSIRCWQDIPTELPALPLRADVRHNVFLALREAFHNVLKHARATEVWVRLRLEQKELVLEAEDNGCGFDPNHLSARGGNGLVNMRSRLDEEHGRLELTSAPGRGTKVRLIVPVTSPE